MNAPKTQSMFHILSIIQMLFDVYLRRDWTEEIDLLMDT